MVISIHAPRTGSDESARRPRLAKKPFQSTLPARGATPPTPQNIFVRRFQSTLPARGATDGDNLGKHCICYFNPRSPHGERHCHLLPRGIPIIYFNPRSPHGERHWMPFPESPWEDISIHAPRTGSDKRLYAFVLRRQPFQSTLPARGATPDERNRASCSAISIHAPRTGSDV